MHQLQQILKFSWIFEIYKFPKLGKKKFQTGFSRSKTHPKTKFLPIFQMVGTIK